MMCRFLGDIQSSHNHLVHLGGYRDNKVRYKAI